MESPFLPPCPACGARRYDRGPHFRILSLCAYCYLNPDERAAALARLRFGAKDRPTPPFASIHAPGSPEKEEVLQWRLKRRYALHHPLDGTAAGVVGIQLPVRDAPHPETIPKELIPGVELDRGKGPVFWRARPRWRDYRVRLGRYREYAKAAEVVKTFYVERWGSWDDSRPWMHQTACLAVVKLLEGWHDLEIPDRVPIVIARRAAGRVVDSQPYEAFYQAETRLRQELRRLAA